jgi:hypothetical protein
MSKLLAGIVAIEAVVCAVLCAAVFGPRDGVDATAAVAARPPDAAPATASAAAANGTAKALTRAAEPAAEPAQSLREATRAKYQPDDLLGVMLTGTVRWRDGSPVDGASLWASHDKANTSGASGPDGRFAMLRLAPGEWQLTVRAEGAV